MISSYFDEVAPYTEIPGWKHFDYEEYAIDETPVIEDNEEMQQEVMETDEEIDK